MGSIHVFQAGNKAEETVDAEEIKLEEITIKGLIRIYETMEKTTDKIVNLTWNSKQPRTLSKNTVERIATLLEANKKWREELLNSEPLYGK